MKAARECKLERTLNAYPIVVIDTRYRLSSRCSLVKGVSGRQALPLPSMASSFVVYGVVLGSLGPLVVCLQDSRPFGSMDHYSFLGANTSTPLHSRTPYHPSILSPSGHPSPTKTIIPFDYASSRPSGTGLVKPKHICSLVLVLSNVDQQT